MRAFVYTENWPKTIDSNKPVTYYVISYYSGHKNIPKNGCSESRSIDESHIREEIIKIQKQINISLFGRLPPRMSPIEKKVLEEHPKKPSVMITREGYGLSFLRASNLPK